MLKYTSKKECSHALVSVDASVDFPLVYVKSWSSRFGSCLALFLFVSTSIGLDVALFFLIVEYPSLVRSIKLVVGGMISVE